MSGRKSNRTLVNGACAKLRCAVAALGLVALLGGSVAQAGTPPIMAPVAPTVPDGFGVNIKWGMTAAQIDALAAAGFRIVRDDLAWDQVETKKGVYNFTDGGKNYDWLVDGMAARDIRVIFILCYGNPLYCGKNDKGRVVGPNTPESRQAFANFAAAATKRYAGKKVIWEIWNEPNGQFWEKGTNEVATTAKLYAELAKTAIPAMRAVDTNAYIIGPALEGPVYGDVFDPVVVKGDYTAWLNELGATGALALFDAISIHPYRAWWPETFVSEHTEMRKLLAHHNIADRPLLTGELGWATWIYYGAPGGKGARSDGDPDGLRNLSRDQQASYLVRNYLVDLSLGVPITIWYCWPDESFNPVKDQNDGFGLINRDGSPKQTYHAAVTMSRLLGGYAFKRRIALKQPHDWLLEFRKGDATAWVAWTEEGRPVRPTPRAVALPIAFVKTFDLYGNSGAATVSKVNLSNEPQYLFDAQASLSAPALTPQARITSWVDVLVRDGAFEQGLALWSFHVMGGAKAAATVDTETKHEGAKSIRLTNASPFGPDVYGWLHQELRLKPGQAYRASLWAKGAGVGKAYCGGFNTRRYLPEGDFDWREFSVDFTADAKGVFQFGFVIESPTAALWLDDLRVEAR